RARSRLLLAEYGDPRPLHSFPTRRSSDLGGAGATAWVHGGGFATYAKARSDRMDRLDELRRRWDEQHEKLRDLVARLKVKAAVNDGFTSRYRAAQTRLRKFEEQGAARGAPAQIGRAHV